MGGVMAIRAFWWMLKGKEVITIGQGALTVEKRGALFYKTKVYDLLEATNFRSQEEIISSSVFGGRRNSLSPADNGTIRFDYGLKTVKFGDGIDETEANFILQKLRNKRIIN